MLIKAADDRQPQIASLDALRARPGVDASTRERIDREIRQIRAGAAGERDAAYEIEFLLGDSRNRMTIHDLRLEVGARVAQIDHLIINRLLDIWVLESKHFGEGVAVNEHGEWVAFYGRRPYGIASPVEQNRRHMAVLEDAFAKGLVPLPKRFGITIRPKLLSLVLVSNGARISRPKGRAAERVEGLETVIKVDQLRATIDRAYDERSLTALRKVVSSETVENVARRLAALHIPASVDWAARFGLPPATGPAAPRVQPTSSGSNRPVCATCGHGVSDAVIAYCASHPERFGGLVYCMTCQKAIGESASR
jgi:hypothetical protein